MKKDWVYKKLGEVANVIHGKNQKEVLSTNGKYPIYGSGGTIMGYATEYLCEAGTTILGRKGTINNPQFINHKFWNVDTAFGISARKDIDSKFLYFFIKKQDWSKMNTGTTLPSLTQAIVKNVIIPVPPLSEQKEIVEYIDSSFAKIDKLKENAAKNLEEAKALFLSALKDALEPKEGWEEKTLKELSEIQSGYAFKSSDFKSSGKYQVIRMGNVRPGVIRYNESPVFINEELDEKAKEKALLQIGDMIITQTGSRNKRDYGFTVLIEKDNLLLNQRIARIRVKDKLLNKYLLYYSWTDYFRDQYFANEGGTVGQGNVGMDAIKDNIIPLPSLPEQQSIVSFLDSLSEKVNTLQQNYSRICDECDALKQAILRQVFE